MNRSILYTLVSFVFAANYSDFRPIENSYLSGRNDPKVINISVITQQEANSLFTKFVQDKEIPFGYPIDGCSPRATLMTQLADKNSIVMGRVVAEGLLQAKTNSVKYPYVQWGWHVAPIAYVRSGAETSRLMVFDPSLFSKPVTVDEWKSKMETEINGNKARLDTVYYGSRHQFLKREQEGYKEAYGKSDAALVQHYVNLYTPLQDFGVSRNGKAQIRKPKNGAR